MSKPADPKLIEKLNEVLTAELTAINQYFIHAKMLASWGYPGLSKEKYDESIDEMRDADKVIDRILFLDGIPNMQRLNPVRVGETITEMHTVDLSLEVGAVERLNGAISYARDIGDNGTRMMLESILTGEEHAVDHLGAQLGIIETIGEAAYLAQHLSS